MSDWFFKCSRWHIEDDAFNRMLLDNVLALTRTNEWIKKNKIWHFSTRGRNSLRENKSALDASYLLYIFRLLWMWLFVLSFATALLWAGISICWMIPNIELLSFSLLIHLFPHKHLWMLHRLHFFFIFIFICILIHVFASFFYI